MKAVILAGGRGTRGRPFTDYIPKAMIPVQGRPLIDHVVRYLSKSRTIDQIIILGNYTGIGKQIEKYFENQTLQKKPIKLVQDTQSGTGGDLVHIKNMIGKDKEFLLWFVDNLCPLDINKMLKFHRTKNSIATIAVRKYRKEETGYAVIDDGMVKEFKEKPTLKLPIAECLGIYILDSKIIKLISSKKKKDLNLSYDVLEPLSKKGNICAFDIEKTPWIDVDSPTRIERNKDLVKNIIKKF